MFFRTALTGLWLLGGRARTSVVRFLIPTDQQPFTQVLRWQGLISSSPSRAPPQERGNLQTNASIPQTTSDGAIPRFPSILQTAKLYTLGRTVFIGQKTVRRPGQI